MNNPASYGEVAYEQPDVSHVEVGLGGMADEAAAGEHGDHKQAGQVDQDGHLERAGQGGGEVAEDQHQDGWEEGGEKFSHILPSQNKR